MMRTLMTASAVGFLLAVSGTVHAEQKLLGEGGKVEQKTDSDQFLLEGLQTATSERFWDLSFRVAQEYESNVKLDDSADNKGDTRTVFGVDAAVHLPKVYDIGTTLSYSLYKDLYAVLDGFNLEGHTFTLGFDRQLPGDVYAYLDTSFAWFEFAGTGYLRHYLVSPSFYWAQNETFASFLRFNWDNNDYLQIRELSGDNYTLSFREFMYLGAQKDKYIWAEYSPNYNSAIADFEAYVGHKISTGFYTPMPWEFGLRGSFSYANNRYIGGDPRFINTVRRDNIFVISSSLTRPLVPKVLTLKIYYTYTRQRSSIDARDYSDQVTGLELQIKF